MKSAPFIPVSLFGEEPYMYSANKHYSIEYLKSAYNMIRHAGQVEGENITDIIVAYNYYKIAYSHAISFEPILGINADQEIAFVSNTFNLSLIHI